MSPEVAWLIEQLEGCAPRDDLPMLADARAAYMPLVEAAHALRTGVGMLFGMSLSSCFDEAREVLEPLLAGKLRQWEQFLLARFGEEEVWEMRFRSGDEPTFAWWIEQAERDLERMLARHRGRPGERRLILHIEPYADDARVTFASLWVGGAADPIAPNRSVLVSAAELEALWQWARDQAAGATRSSPPGEIILPRLEITLGEPRWFELAWWYRALGLSAMRPTGILIQSWPKQFDRHWEPSGCHVAIDLRDDAAELALRSTILNIEPAEEQDIHDWAASLARAADLEQVQLKEQVVCSGIARTESRHGRLDPSGSA